MTAESSARPNWGRLFEVAVGQEGYFTTEQAAQVGYSAQLLVHYVRSGKVIRVRRGVYRLVHYPASEHDDLIVVWLWSAHEGVFSHQTALALHGLSDVLPARLHLTLPMKWRHRRLRTPPGVVLHFADVHDAERSWFGAVPVTIPSRTIIDCVATHVSPELLQQAVQQAISRGLLTQEDAAELQRVTKAFSGSVA
ncbi:MAG TPA: type IV toxin-antitoxin system AbiEi family antitoxin domain-containing protein [Myxococcaceae bacterium]|nr:type IV toxin-antitoxin system AbiEi family antitoxin domain-containing protein [Myxococcaceae bacterium]